MNTRIQAAFMLKRNMPKPLSEDELRAHARLLAKRFESYAEHGEDYALAPWVKAAVMDFIGQRTEEASEWLHRKLMEYAWDYVLGHQSGEATVLLAFRARGEDVPADYGGDLLASLLGVPGRGPIAGPLMLATRVYCGLADGLRDAPEPPDNKIRDPLRAKMLRACPINIARLQLPPLSLDDVAKAQYLVQALRNGELEARDMSDEEQELFCRAIIDPGYRYPTRENLTRKT